MLLASTDKNKSPGIASSNALLVQWLRVFFNRLNPFDAQPVQAAFRPKKAACTSQKNASTEFCAKQEHDTGYAQAFCGLMRQQGKIQTMGQNNRHETKEIKSVFQAIRRFRAHTTCPSINVLKTIRELK